MIKSFLDLEVYKESFQLSLEVEELLKYFPKNEEYLLVDQSKRACPRSKSTFPPPTSHFKRNI